MLHENNIYRERGGQHLKELKIKALTDNSFKDYGRIVKRANIKADANEPTHNWWGKVAKLKSEDDISVGLLEVKKRNFTVNKLEEHDKTTEMLIALEGNSFLVVGRLNHNRGLEKINAFYLKEGQVVILDVSTLHWIPYPLGNSSLYAVVFRTETPEDDLSFINLNEELKIVL